MKDHGFPPFVDPFIEYVSKSGSSDDAIAFLSSMTSKRFPSMSVVLRVFEAFLKAARQNEAQDLLSECPGVFHVKAQQFPLLQSDSLRKVTEASNCSFCKQDEESVTHASRDSSKVDEVWKIAQLQENGQKLKRSGNEWRYQRKLGTAAFAMKFFSECQLLKQDKGSPVCRTVLCWQAPQLAGTKKTNFDGALETATQKGSSGIIAKDYKGRVLEAAQFMFQGVMESEAIEILAAIKAMEFAQQMGFTRIIVEGEAWALLTVLIMYNRIFQPLNILCYKAMLTLTVAKLVLNNR
ncbi:hypothetical protein CRYUN_Cryun24cG0031600 [Craigia yunnanensis]